MVLTRNTLYPLIQMIHLKEAIRMLVNYGTSFLGLNMIIYIFHHIEVFCPKLQTMIPSLVIKVLLIIKVVTSN